VLVTSKPQLCNQRPARATVFNLRTLEPAQDAVLGPGERLGVPVPVPVNAPTTARFLAKRKEPQQMAWQVTTQEKHRY
jgi:hypothetical protein